MDVIPERGRLDLGEVLQDLVRGTLADWKLYLLLGVALYVPMLAVSQLASPFAKYAQPAAGAPPQFPGLEAWLIQLGLTAVFWAVMLVYYALILRTGYGRLRGRPVATGEAARRVGRRLFSIGVVGLLWGVLVFLGAMLCLLPGIAVAVVFYPILAVAVCEDLGIFDTFNRAWELTEGYRWHVLAVLAIVTIVDLALTGLIMPLALTGKTGWSLALTGIKGVAYEPFKAMSVAAIYVHLRRAHDNLDVEDVAEVFA